MERKETDIRMNGKSMTRQAELEELRRRMEAREARARAAEQEALANSNIEELRRRLVARKAAAEQGIEYDDGGSRECGNGGRGEKRRPAMEMVAEYAYMCAPALSGLLMLLLGFISVRAVAVRAVGNMWTERYVAQPVLAAGHTADLADPFADRPQAEPETVPLALPSEEPEDGDLPPEPVLPEEETMIPEDEMPLWLFPAAEPDAQPDSSPAGEPESAADSAR